MAAQPFGYVCTRCGEARDAWASSCVVVVPAKTGGVKHAYSATYDGFGCAETPAGERVHLAQFRTRWAADFLPWDLELPFTPVASEVYCNGHVDASAAKPAGGGSDAAKRSCVPKGLAPQRALRPVRETLQSCKDVQAEAARAAAALPTRYAVAEDAAAAAGRPKRGSPAPVAPPARAKRPTRGVPSPGK